MSIRAVRPTTSGRCLGAIPYPGRLTVSIDGFSGFHMGRELILLAMVGFTVIPCVHGAPALKERAQASLIVGEWEVLEGKTESPYPTVAFGHDSSRYRFAADGHWFDATNGSGRYSIYEKPVPHTIKLVQTAGNPVGEYSGTFELMGDSLILTLPVQPNGAKSIIKLQRIKKD